MSLKLLNLGDRAFVCTVPFQRIKYLENSAKKEEVKMKIKDYLRVDRILLTLNTHNKEEAIEEIAAVFLKDSTELIDFDIFLRDVFKRETVNTTGIGNEIAMPHARSDAVKDFVIAFGRSREGVQFNSLDGKPANLIFLIVTSKEKCRLDSYLRILARLTSLLQNKSFRNSLLEASSPKEVINIFQEAEV